MHRSVILLVAILLVASGTHATTFRVNPDGSGDYPTIQEGIWAAADGDTVELGNGVFRGNWNRLIDFVAKAVTVRSAGDNPDSCVIDIEGTPDDQRFGFVFHSAEGPDSRLEGVTITGGFDLGC